MIYLEKLSNAFGVSSVEGEVRKIILEAVQEYADEWHVDTIGNLFITRKARVDSPEPVKRVMLAAHMDEVGLMISEIKSDGLLKFKPIGGFDPRVLPGKSLTVGKERLAGVIAVKPIHLLEVDELGKVDSIDSMTIDIGATSKSDCKVSIGEFATFSTKFGYLGGDSGQSRSTEAHESRLVKGKAFDDRAGCAVLIELLKGNYPMEMIAVFTVQEEIGTRGAKVAAYRVNPDLAFILEATAADDLPRSDKEAEIGFPRLGEGPAITVMDRSFIANRGLVDWLINTAEANGIPHQFKKPGIGGTDAGAIHLAREGVPSAVVSIPTRYIHSPVSVLDLADFENIIKLMQALLVDFNMQRIKQMG